MTRPELALFALAASALLATAVGPGLGAAEKPLSLASEWADVKVEPTKIGEVRRFFKAPTATVGELAVHVTTINAGEASHAPHRHPEEELIIIKEGTVESFQDGTTRRLGPGSVIFQASNELHGLRNVGTGPATYHVVKWTLVPPADKPKP
jgi:XRE family transcriptional regulator, regulator of sulfur utilization